MIKPSCFAMLVAALLFPSAVVADGPDATSAGSAAEASPLGYRYGRLSVRETKALRRGFKLPMDALADARGVEDLAARAVVAPLPPIDRPFLAIQGAAETDARNPFADRVATSFREDPMRALGELLGASGLDETPEAGSPSDESLMSSTLDGLDDASGPAGSDSDAEVADAGDDPFADEGDPFGGEDDPFAF